MATSRKHKTLRIVLGILLLTFVGITGFGMWFSYHYKAILRDNIPKWIAKATDGVYTVSYTDLNINLFTRRVSIKDMQLHADTNRINALKAACKAPETFFDVSIPLVQAWGISWADIVANKQFSCKLFRVWQPDIKVTYNRVPDSLKKFCAIVAPADTNKKDPAITAFSVAKILVTEPKVSYKHSDTGGTYTLSIGSGSITLEDWAFDKDKPKDTTRFLFAKKAMLDIDSFMYEKEKKPYRIKAAHISLSTEDNKLTLKDLSIKATVSKDEFYKMIGHQNDMFDINFKSISTESFDWRRLMNEKTIAMRSVSIENGSMEDYFSRLVPENTQSKKGKYPNQLLMRMKMKVDVDTVHIKNGHFQYTEVNEKTHRAGALKFDGIDGYISNATNIPEKVASNSSCLIRLRGMFMKKSPITANFNLSLSDSSGAFAVDGTLKDCDAAQINDMTKALAVTEIESVHISSINLHVAGDENRGSGTVTMIYNDLKVVPQKVGDDKKLSDNSVLSFLANTLLVYPDNPMKGEPVRTESSAVVRDQYKSFFNLIWKCIFNSIEKTAIKSDNVAQALQDKQAHPKEKKSLLSRIFGGKKDKGDKKDKDDKKKDDKKDDDKKDKKK